MKRLLIILLFSNLIGKAQSYPPAAGFEGSTAIHKDSIILVNWATDATVIRGYKNSAYPENGFVSYGEIADVIGKVEDNPHILSLGDNGSITLSFSSPIVNGEGPDFAIFENGFFENEISENAFLELAFVEVSTDGEKYVRFPAISEIQTDLQIGSFESINARFIHNFAGKYTKPYGTPFDLEEIKELVVGTSVNINEINYIKIIDVVGNIDEEYSSFDSLDNIINDPYPTEFESGGFDLDAVGVIHDQISSLKCTIIVFPNPVFQKIYFKNGKQTPLTIDVYSILGELLLSKNKQTSIDVSYLKKGMYIINLSYIEKSYSQLIIKN